MRKIFFVLVLFLISTNASAAGLWGSMDALGTPATASDAIATSDDSTATKTSQLLFSSVVTECLNGDGGWSAFAPTASPTFTGTVNGDVGTFTGTITADTYSSSAADGSRYQTYPNNTTGNEPGHVTVVNGFYSFENTLYMVENSIDGYAMIDSNDIGSTVHAEDDGAFTGAVSGTTGTFTGTLSGELGVTLDSTSTTPITLTAAQSRGAIRISSYAGIKTYNLPVVEAGLNVCVYVSVAQVITLEPNGTNVITLDGTALTAGVNIDSAGGAGDFACLLGIDATNWLVLGKSGTWVVGD